MPGKPSSPTRIHVSIDSRIELLSIVLKLSGYGNLYKGRINDTTSPYLQAVENYFGKYTEHDSIRYFHHLNHHISGDLPVAIALYLSEPPDLELRTPFDSMIKSRVKDNSELTQYVTALRKFALDSNFGEFFNTHNNYYTSLLVSPKKSILDANPLKTLEDYFGWGQPVYFVIFAPLLKTIAFGPRVNWANGKLEPYCVFPAFGVNENGLITFKEGKALQNRILHEFGHSFINPLVDQYKDELSKYARLTQSVIYKTKANYGAEWHISVYEHLVRAVTTRLTYHQFGEEAGEKEMEAHKDQGFIYIHAICERLKTYEKERETYPNFANFFPQLVNTFKLLSEKTAKV